MKKIFTMMLAAGLLTLGAHAQNAPSKEEKAKAKAQKEQALNDAIKELAISTETEAKLRAVLDEANAKSKELKNDASISEEVKAVKKEVINDEKNTKLKAVLGEEKYKQWTAIRKKQKEAMPAAPPQNP